MVILKAESEAFLARSLTFKLRTKISLLVALSHSDLLKYKMASFGTCDEL
jgi:hypothetical protein